MESENEFLINLNADLRVANAATIIDRLNREAAEWRERALKAERERDETRVLIAQFEGRSEEAVIASREADAAEAELVTLRAELAAVKAERSEAIEHSQKLAAAIRDMQVSGQSLRASRDALRTALEGAEAAMKQAMQNIPGWRIPVEKALATIRKAFTP